MQVWEAHRMLSQQIGDTVVCTSTAVPPDGVRYTRQMRDAYLYRAMLNRMEKALQLVSSIGGNRSLAGKVLTPAFGDMVRETEMDFVVGGPVNGMNFYFVDLSTLDPRPAYIFSIVGQMEESGTNHNYIPIPIKNYHEISSHLNGRIVQRSDAFAGLYLNSPEPFIAIYYDGVELDGGKITLTYLPYPIDPSTQSGTLDKLTEVVGGFQLSMMGTIMGLATLYAKMDDQETGSLERFGPQLLEMQIANNINVGGDTPQ